MENKEEVKKEYIVDTNLKEYFKKNIDEIMKYLIELYEFQEGIKFINTKIEHIK